MIRFDGFIAAYIDTREEGEASDDDEDDGPLPEIRAQEALTRDKINASQHFTEPPPRYSEATLIKKMEELGIGRPSTYASTLATLRDRDYVVIDKRKLIPAAKGRLVTAFLESFFTRYVEYDFTPRSRKSSTRSRRANSTGRTCSGISGPSSSPRSRETKELRVTNVLDALNEHLASLVFPKREDGSDPRICQSCGTGQLSLKLGKYGAFIGCSNYPECKFHPAIVGRGQCEAEANGNENRALGRDPVTARRSPCAPAASDPMSSAATARMPKRASLPKGWTPQSIRPRKGDGAPVTAP